MRFLVITLLLAPAVAHAQSPAQTGRARMELAFDHGYGGGSEGGYFELAGDLRIWAPFGLGLIVRTGAASNGFSWAIAADVGAGLRIDLVSGRDFGLDLFFAVGASAARGPFQGDLGAFGPFWSAGFDFRHQNLVVGIAAVAHVMWLENHGNEGARETPLWTLAPVLRIGGDWGL